MEYQAKNLATLILLLHTSILNVFEMLRKLFYNLRIRNLIFKCSRNLECNRFYIMLAEHMAGNISVVDIAYT